MHIKSLLAIFLLSLSASSFADSTCGLIPGTDRIDGFSTTICPQNKASQLMFSFGGVASTAGIGSLDGKAAQAIQDEMTDAQTQQSDANARLMGLANEYAWKITVIFSTLLLICLAAWILVKAMKGKMTEGGSDKSSSLGLTALVILGMGIIIAPGVIFGASIYQYFKFMEGNVSLSGEQFFIQNYAASIQQGSLETTKEGLEKDSTTLINGHTKAFAKAITSALVSKSTLQQVNSPIHQFYFNMSNGIDYKRYIPISEIMQRKDNQFTFKSMNPEKPNELLYSFAPMNFFNAPFPGSRTQVYLDAIGYADKYKKDSSIENVMSRVAQLKADLGEAIKKTNDKNETYEYIVNSAVAVYFYDLRSNWTAKKVEELLKSERLRAVGEAFVNGICAENPIESGIGKEIINQKKGFSQCITNDWKQAGTKKAEEYNSFISHNIESIENEFYDGLLLINNSYGEAIENTDVNKQLLRVVQGGAIDFFWNINEIQNKLSFMNESTKNFSTLSFFNIVDPSATGTFVKDEWLKNHGAKFEALDMNDYVRRFFTMEDINKDGYTTQDAQTQIQDALIKNSAATSSVKVYEQGTGLALESLTTTLQRNMGSSQSAQSGIQDFGINVIRTASKGLVWTVGTAVLAKNLDQFATSKDKTNTVETATVSTDKKAKQKGQSGKFTLFSMIQDLAAIIMIPVLFLAMAIGAMYAYVLPVLSVFPFFIAYIILKLSLILQIVFSVFVIFSALKIQTGESVGELLLNQLYQIMGNCASCLIVLLMFTMNTSVTDTALRFFFQYFAPAYADNVSQSSGSIMTFVNTYALIFIGMYFVQVSLLIISIGIINKFFALFKHDYAYAKIIINSLDKTLYICNIASVGLTSKLIDIFTIANKKALGKSYR